MADNVPVSNEAEINPVINNITTKGTKSDAPLTGSFLYYIVSIPLATVLKNYRQKLPVVINKTNSSTYGIFTIPATNKIRNSRKAKTTQRDFLGASL